MTEDWRRHGLDMDIVGLTYPNEYDRHGHMPANVWTDGGTVQAHLTSAQLQACPNFKPLTDRTRPTQSANQLRASHPRLTAFAVELSRSKAAFSQPFGLHHQQGQYL